MTNPCSCRHEDATICCGSPVDAPDQCLCGGPCLNGPIQVASAQILTFAGFLFSIATLTDCSFLSVQIEENDQLWTLGKEGRRGVGFFLFEDASGSCYMYGDVDTEMGERIFESYWDFLGSSWGTSRAFAFVALVSSFCVWFYMLSYSCSAQPKVWRWTTGLVICTFMVTFQALCFVVYATAWCDDHECQFSRSSGWAIGAAASYTLSAICFFLTSDYPGAKTSVVASNGDHAAVVMDEEVCLAQDTSTDELGIESTTESHRQDSTEKKSAAVEGLMLIKTEDDAQSSIEEFDEHAVVVVESNGSSGNQIESVEESADAENTSVAIQISQKEKEADQEFYQHVFHPENFDEDVASTSQEEKEEEANNDGLMVQTESQAENAWEKWKRAFDNGMMSLFDNQKPKTG